MSNSLKSVPNVRVDRKAPSDSLERMKEFTIKVGSALGQVFGRKFNSGNSKAFSKNMQPDNGAVQMSCPGRISVLDARHSQAEWNNFVAGFSAELVREVYRGLLGREPDEKGQAAYEALLVRTNKLAAVLAEVICSVEFWKRTLESNSSQVVRQMFLGLLGREPGREEVTVLSAKLAGTRDLAAVLADVALCGNTWENMCSAHSERLVHESFRGLLGRNPEEKGLQLYGGQLKSSHNLAHLISTLVDSREFSLQFSKRRKLPNPARWFTDPCYVFLHIMKTAGTSVQNHLIDCFGRDTIYYEYQDFLHTHAPGELARFNVFAGHFNYDSLRFIPRQTLSIFTFLREPRQRLLSLYYYLRAHDAGHRQSGRHAELANQLDIEEFFECPEIRGDVVFEDHMCMAIMGRSQWRKWLSMLAETRDAKAYADMIETIIRPEIVKRLQEFVFIGLQEDFEASIQLLFRTVLKAPPPSKVRADHSLALLMSKNTNFKKSMKKQPMTPRLDSAMEFFYKLDKVVYEEGRKIYTERLAKYNPPASSEKHVNPRRTIPTPHHQA